MQREKRTPWHVGEWMSNPIFQERLATFPAGFFINFLGKPAKIANNYHLIAEHLETACKYEQIVQHPKYDHMTKEAGTMHRSTL